MNVRRRDEFERERRAIVANATNGIAILDTPERFSFWIQNRFLIVGRTLANKVSNDSIGAGNRNPSKRPAAIEETLLIWRMTYAQNVSSRYGQRIA